MIETRVIVREGKDNYLSSGKLLDCFSFPTCCQLLGKEDWWFAGFDPDDDKVMVFQRESPKV